MLVKMVPVVVVMGMFMMLNRVAVGMPVLLVIKHSDGSGKKRRRQPELPGEGFTQD